LKLEKNIVIITGGPGFGKTGIIEELKKMGRFTCPEFVRDVISFMYNKDSDFLPWENLKRFQKEITIRRMNFYLSVDEKSDFVFSDRGLPDQIAFARYHKNSPSSELTDFVNDCRYFRKVFITPPWKKIYVSDEIRKETYEESCSIHKYIMGIYSELEYSMVEIPFGKPSERAKFILDNLE